MTAPGHFCPHLLVDGPRFRAVVMGISIEVCSECAQELEARLIEAKRPETPIEQYAKEKEAQMVEQEIFSAVRAAGGCVYSVGNKPMCRAAVVPGKQHCPKHQAMIDALAARAAALAPASPIAKRRR